MKVTNVSCTSKFDAAWFLLSFESRYIVKTDMHNYVRTIGIAKFSVYQIVSLDLLRIPLNNDICATSKYLFIILTVIIFVKTLQ